MGEQKIFRCAIYTRKSSEEGLEQDFNSLEAQREACEAYIRSQAHEGWKLISDRYDDGGFSGGNMERPALKQLMDKIRAKEIDTIVVYKIDRLTRSLTDFARLADLLDQHKVSFVSVTQQFNTTTSMGRLMLNVLLSFAQFEREITGERIRDKIAASKRKGMWMGGVPPMGYDIKDRQLVVNERYAETVGQIFKLYLETKTVPALIERLDRDQIRTAKRYSAKGNHYGERPFTRGHLYKLLTNPIYIGRVPHGKTSHRGLHAAIIEKPLWDAVQALLEENTQGARERRRTKAVTWLLEGLLHSERGNRFIANHATKGSRRYRYYVEQVGSGTTDGSSPKAHRLPAREIEEAVLAGLKSVLADHRGLLARFSDFSPAHRSQVGDASNHLIDLLSSRRGVGEAVKSVVQSVEYRHDRLALTVSTSGLARALFRIETHSAEGSNVSPDEDLFAVTAPLTHRRRGVQMKLALAGKEPPRDPDPSLVTAIVRAWDWADRLVSGKVSTMAEICAEEGFSDTYVGQVLPLACLAPEIVELILQGGQPSDMSADKMIWDFELATSWKIQRTGPIASASKL